MSVIIDIADALTAELNGPDSPKFGSPPVGLSAQRSYKPGYELAELKDLRVTVVPKGVEMQGITRSIVQHEVQIDIGVQKKLDTAEAAEIDALMNLVEKIADFLRLCRLPLADLAWVRTENAPIFAPDHLDQMRAFTSVLTATYRVLR